MDNIPISQLKESDWQKSGSFWFELLNITPRDDLYLGIGSPKLGTKISDDAAMFLAWTIALRGVGNVSPNPLVGAVIQGRNGQFLSMGAHQELGKAHAEVNAIKMLSEGDDLNGATLFVTLEPCAHEGRTPSCAKLIASTGISRIVYGLCDPNPKVSGLGVKILRDAGKTVERSASWQSRCEWLTRVFLRNQNQHEVFTAIKVASTPSGVIAGDGTTRLWITGERAREMGHFLRLEYDAILVGINTVFLDDPSLTVRHPRIAGRTPLRILLDHKGALVNDIRTLKLLAEDPQKTLVIFPEQIEAGPFVSRHNVKTIKMPLNACGHFEWASIKKVLWEMGVMSLLIEGGAGIYKTALNAMEIQLLHWFVAPESGLKGLKWDVIPDAYEIYKKGGGTPLGNDKLVEFKI